MTTGSTRATAVQRQARDVIEQRAQQQLRQSRLVVDFYRIRRRLAYPLPVTEHALPNFPTRLRAWYPWDTWMAWAYEERVAALGWAGHWLDDAGFRRAADADVAAMAAWRRWHSDRPDGLIVGHFLRTMTGATRAWPWLSSETRDAVTAACQHLVDHYAHWLDGEDEYWQRRMREPDHPDFKPVSNITLIGTLGLSLAARQAQHPRRDWLEMQTLRLSRAVLDQHRRGDSEGVAYDGYMLDFIADWLVDAAEAARGQVLDDAEVPLMLEQSVALAAPGGPTSRADVARLGDVEPVEMPFHLSALAKLRAFRPASLLDWHLSRVELSRMRSDGLAALAAGRELDVADPPAAPLATRISRVCRSGWTQQDMAVVISTHSSTMGHLHSDIGSIVIAAGGRWMIDDPGYQQYMATQERDFTLGPAAHNRPLVNGEAQRERRGRVVTEPESSGGGGGGVRHMAVDLAACYEPAPTRCVRHVWLVGRRVAIVADDIAWPQLERVGYHWHGHTEAAWWVEAGMALVYVETTSLWLRCLQAPLEQEMIDRRRGSRGQLTLSLDVPVEQSGVVWWAFGEESSLRGLEPAGDGRSLRCDAVTMEVAAP